MEKVLSPSQTPNNENSLYPMQSVLVILKVFTFLSIRKKRLALGKLGRAFSWSPKQGTALLSFLPTRVTWKLGLDGTERKQVVPACFIDLLCQHLSLNQLFWRAEES